MDRRQELAIWLLQAAPVLRETMVDLLPQHQLSSNNPLSIFLRTCLTAFFIAGIGPVPIIAGSKPACAQETMRANGVRPLSWAIDFFIRITAAAPSFIPGGTDTQITSIPLRFRDPSLYCRGCKMQGAHSPEALPEVTLPVPSVKKYGFRFDMVS